MNMDISARAVPIIDLTPLTLPDAAAHRRLAREVDHACRDIGFLVIAGHGIPGAGVERAFAAGNAFFAQPPHEKARSVPLDGRVRGYTAIGRQGLAYSLGEETPPDLFERFRMGRFDFPDDEYHRARRNGFFAENLWPREPAEFRPALSSYYAAMEALAERLMRLFALALDLPRDFFADKIDRHVSSLCLNFYPSQPEAPLPGQLRAGAHTDYGSLTIVAPTQAPGALQVLDRGGEWRDVDPPPGTFVVNLGDLMAQWTNDRWVSTLHRVANPPREVAGDSERLSLVFFHQPNDDALIECLPSCCAERAPKYAPVTSGEHFTGKIRKAFDMKAATP
jgi:isopenicillin N synthase-like dioxygenase